MRSDPKWDLYPSFAAVMALGNLSAAARSLDLTQPTLGRHIEALERDLGLPLFTRSPQGLAPTQAAFDLLPYVKAMAASADALLRHATSEAKEDKGTIRLAASNVIGSEVLPDILARFINDHPRIQIELATSNKVEDLLRREVDIAVRMVRPEQSALRIKRVGEAEIGLFAHKDYLARFGTPKSLQELTGHRIIGFDRDSSFEKIIRGLGIDFERSQFSLRTDDDRAILRATRVGYGIGGVQWALASRWPDLVPVLPEVILFKFETWIAMHEDLAASYRMRLMFDYLVGKLSSYFAGGIAERAKWI
jgi:DNA-binding transcriptional LysR family regulator